MGTQFSSASAVSALPAIKLSMQSFVRELQFTGFHRRVYIDQNDSKFARIDIRR